MNKKILILFFAIISISNMFAAVLDGKCGDNLYWSLNTKDSTLVITGTGDMYDSRLGWEQYCNRIAYITLPEGLTEITIDAFSGCVIKSITIPSTVTNIFGCAFQSCKKLGTVTILGSKIKVWSDAFDGTWITKLILYAKEPPQNWPDSDVGIKPANCKLFVPAESVDIYDNTLWWEDFKEIKSIESMTDLNSIQCENENTITTKKIIEEGEICIILPDGRKFNVLGVEVK